MKKQSIAIIGVIAFVLAVAVGYALFSQTVTVKGTATASGNFNVKIVEVGTPTCVGVTTCTAAALVTAPTTLPSTSAPAEEVTLSIPLNYPGAEAKIPVTVKNLGSIKALLKTIGTTSYASEHNIVTVDYKESDCTSAITTSNGVLDVEGTHTYCVVAKWAESDTSNTTTETATFNFAFTYEQVTADNQ